MDRPPGEIRHLTLGFRIVALDLETGKLKWHFQFTPHDTHDWDGQGWPVLVDMPFDGRMRKLLLHPNRNGFFYVLDRTTGEFLRATSYMDQLTWASGVVLVAVTAVSA